MDKFLRPERFDADSSIPDSESKGLHWHRTLSNFIDSLEQAEEDINKLNIITYLLEYTSISLMQIRTETLSSNGKEFCEASE